MIVIQWNHYLVLLQLQSGRLSLGYIHVVGVGQGIIQDVDVAKGVNRDMTEVRSNMSISHRCMHTYKVKVVRRYNRKKFILSAKKCYHHFRKYWGPCCLKQNFHPFYLF